MIEVPAKIWRPKVVSKYTIPDYEGEDVNDILDYKQYGRCVYRNKLTWSNTSIRTDVILFDEVKHSAELKKDLKFDKDLDKETEIAITNMVKNYWDCFVTAGAKRTILGYEFGIDTAGAKPVCCRKPLYGHYESKVILEQVQQLLINGWIEKCEGPWGSMVVLAQKPHQEHITDINNFVWRMCVSYRKLNAVTKPFQFPIPRCDAVIVILGCGADEIWIISLDARQGYHQIAVRKIDREKLAFFSPDDLKYCFNVMPFGPTNAPAFYTAMMKNFKDEWDILFIITVMKLKTHNALPISLTANNDIIIGGKKLIWGSKTIIDDILLWCAIKKFGIILFESVCRVFKKYRVSFRLDKCEFLKSRVEYVGHDILRKGNCPAQSKFNLIQDWKLPTSGSSLFSFIGLVNFYHKYAPYMEIRLKPLRNLVKLFYRKPIPSSAWTKDLKQLFEDLKVCITSSPVLARFDSTKPTFLKTDWSSEGMGWILMQPADDEKSKQATEKLIKEGVCLFDLSKSGARLKPIAFGSRSCNVNEKHFHSFTGEASCGRWAIGQNRRFLWGSHFWWLCDCSAMTEILDYDGNIPMIGRWAQELLGYHFTVVHRSNRMMVDVDALSRRYGPLIATHCSIAGVLHVRDIERRPEAYDKNCFLSSQSSKLSVTNTILTTTPILSSIFIMSTPSVTKNNTISSTPIPIISTSPILFFNTSKDSHSSIEVASNTTEMRIKAIAKEIFSEWICIDDIIGSSLLWSQNVAPASAIWNFTFFFTQDDNQFLFQQVHKDAKSTTQTCQSLLETIPYSQTSVIDISFIPKGSSSIFEWCELVKNMFLKALTLATKFRLMIAWIPETSFPSSIRTICLSKLQEYVPASWVLHCSLVESQHHGDRIAANRFVISIMSALTAPTTLENIVFHHDKDINMGYSECLSMNLDRHAVLKNISLPKIICKSRDEFSPQVVAVIHSSNNKEINTMSACNCILNPMHPAMEPVPLEYKNGIFGRRFGVLILESEEPVSARCLTNSELLACYSLPLHSVESFLDNSEYTNTLDNLLPCSIPIKLRASITSQLINLAGFTEDITYGASEVADSFQCYQMSASPTTVDWTNAYIQDNSTRMIYEQLTVTSKPIWTPDILKLTQTEFHQHLKSDCIRMLHNKLIIYKPIFKDLKYIGLIIVPTSLRRVIFSHYHAGPSGAHMGEYKTLFRIRMRFWWPGMRKDIKLWIKSCAACAAYNVWKNRRSELYFSWPITSPFYIMHVDLWMPGKLVNDQGETLQLMNCMCDLTQFVISILVKEAVAETLAKLFMEQVVLSFGMVAVIVVDADSKFLGTFQMMCNALDIKLWPLARGNHKGLLVEKYHRFLNKTQAIIGAETGTHMSFLQNYKTSQYGWNSAPIDDTDIPRSIAAVGRHFKFPMDVKLAGSPTLNSENNSALYKYLRDVSNDSAFATSVLQVLIEERRTTHRERWNVNHVAKPFELGDVVKAHVQVQSNSKTGVVKKLSFQAKGPFQIVQKLEGDSYMVQRYGDNEAPTRKYKGSELYLLPASIFPHDPVDTMDQRYLNFSNSSIVSPFKKPLQIELYNDTFFPTNSKHIIKPSLDQPSCQIDHSTFKLHDSIDGLPPTATLFKESNINQPSIDFEETEDTITPCYSASDFNNLSNSLFFIQYTPEGTMRRRWYLIQVDIVSTKKINPDFASNGEYWCVFLATHPDDNKKSHELSRWWPEWYRYTTCNKSNDIIYGDRILIRPSTTPCSSKFIQWAMLLPLYNNNAVALVGPFNFEPISMSNRVKQKVHTKQWNQLTDACKMQGILPPTMGTKNSHRISKIKEKGNRNCKRKR